MEEYQIKQAMSAFYGQIYDGAIAHIREYLSIRDNIPPESRVKAGSIDELKAVVQLTLAVTASMFEESENERFLQIESDDDWIRPIVRYIVEYRGDICESPDYSLDPIQGWVEDPSEEGFLRKSARESPPSQSIMQWTIENRNN